jgi:hypothetical protein
LSVVRRPASADFSRLVGNDADRIKAGHDAFSGQLDEFSLQPVASITLNRSHGHAKQGASPWLFSRADLCDKIAR